jgi:biotin synthase-like enzyme
MHQCIIQWIGDSVEMVKGETSLMVAATAGKARDTEYLKVSDFGLKPIQAIGSDDKI